MSVRSGASLAWSPRLGFDFFPDPELCKTFQVCCPPNIPASKTLTCPPLRQTVSRILALEALPKGIQTEERFVDVAAIPMGIDVISLSEKRYVTDTS